MIELDDPPVCSCKEYDLFMCVDGDIYGPCSWDDCYGACQYDGKCGCVCHGNVVALRPPLICVECRGHGFHKMDCSRDRVFDKELIVA
jgi:hypothetical protein